MGSNRQIRNCQTTGYFPEHLCNAGCESIKIHPAPSGGRLSSKSMFEKNSSVEICFDASNPRESIRVNGNLGVEELQLIVRIYILRYIQPLFN